MLHFNINFCSSFVWLPHCLSVHLSACLSVSQSVCQSGYLSVCPRSSVHLYVCQSVCQPACLFVCLFFYVFFCWYLAIGQPLWIHSFVCWCLSDTVVVQTKPTHNLFFAVYFYLFIYFSPLRNEWVSYMYAVGTLLFYSCSHYIISKTGGRIYGKMELTANLQ